MEEYVAVKCGRFEASDVSLPVTCSVPNQVEVTKQSLDHLFA